MIAQQMTSNGTILPKKTTHAYDDVISFDVIVRRKISKLCPPCQLLPTTPLLVNDIAKLSPSEQTSHLESYHNIVLHFAPKQTHFHFQAMTARYQDHKNLIIYIDGILIAPDCFQLSDSES